MITDAIPAPALETLRRTFTAEITTVNRQGQPITWPAVAYLDEASGRIVCAVSIAFPVKAHNARRHPQVSLLYSDRTGSGLDDQPAVLVQGTAEVAEVLEYPPDVIGLFATVARRQPDSERFTSNRVVRRFFSWYLFQRIALRITPERVTVWPAGDFTARPETFEVPRGG